jgi:hypothetical protein
MFTVFRHVAKTCYNLMPNPSWDASQWHNIRTLKKSIGCHHRGEIHVLPLLGEFCHRNLLHFEHFCFWGLGAGIPLQNLLFVPCEGITSFKTP